MARVPAEDIERLKVSVDLVALVQAKGIALKRHGENWIGCCPFHDDRTPSLVVTPSKNLWHCLGACQVGGSVIDWVMRMEHVSFRHAVELLLVKDSAALVSDKPRMRAPKLISPVESSLDDQALLKQVTEFYHETLLSRAPEARQYLQCRGIDNPEAIEKFRLGFSNRTLGLRLPESRVEEGGRIRERLMALGIYRETGHEHFSGSLVIPVMDEDGAVREIYGRKITPKLREGTAYHTYLPGAHRGIFNPEGLSSGEVILCESLIDALSFWVNGFHNVTASYGVEGFTKDHLAYFAKYKVRRVYIAYDRDAAGDAAAAKLAKKLFAHDIESLRVKFPRGMDANDYILKVKPPSASLKVCLDAAEWLHKRVAVKSKNDQPSFLAAAPSVAASPTDTSLSLPKTPSETIPETPDEPAVPEVAALWPAAMPPAELPSVAVPPVALEIFKALPASPTGSSPSIAASPSDPVVFEMRGEDVYLRIANREYRVRGLKKNLAFEILRVNIRVSISEKYHIDTIDLYQAKARTHFIHASATELGEKEDVIKSDLGRVLYKLEELQEAAIRQALESGGPKPYTMTETEKEEALSLLTTPNLLQRILADFSKCGVIGEETNKLAAYLAATSRKLDEPLAIIVQSASAAGKSRLMDAVLALMPMEDAVKYSSMTGQSLFYMGETDLKYKILAISEEQGASQATYALKLLQSEGEISIASTGKDHLTGRLVTHQYRVEGPVMIMLTTTSVEIDEELLNRCLVLTVNETREQTKLIHDEQRRAQTLHGRLMREERSHIVRAHQNAQRLLRPLWVVNPFAERLTFLDSRTRTRRDHVKYLTLIRTIALLHQYQREVKWVEHSGKNIEYIEVEARDIVVANELSHKVLGRSLDELPPQARKLLLLLGQMVEEKSEALGVRKNEYRFTRRDVRAFTQWSDFQVQVHLTKLVSLEYVLVHRGGRGQSFVYELLFDQRVPDAEPHLSGLLDPSHLTQSFEGKNTVIEGSNSPHLAPVLAGCRSAETSFSKGSPVKNEDFSLATHNLASMKGTAV